MIFGLLNNLCFLCTKITPEQFHRRLLAEFIKSKFRNVGIMHL